MSGTGGVGGVLAPAAPYAPIDPLASIDDGVYRDALVEVRHQGSVVARRLRHMVRTESFDVLASRDRISVVHRVPPEAVDDDLAGRINDQLFDPGWLRGSDLFERIFTGVVRTSAPGALASWELFYRNTLDRVEESVRAEGAEGAETRGHAHGTIADYAPVYAHAEELVVGETAYELGSCFGFLSLRLAASGLRVTASDVSLGTMRLLGEVAPRLGLAVAVQPGDAARLEVRDGCAETVLAIHLLEHLDAEHGRRVLAEAVRISTRRVVVAVPLEEVADPAWGHLRTISLRDLADWGAASGLAYDVHERNGGWLVLDHHEPRQPGSRTPPGTPATGAKNQPAGPRVR